MNCKNCGSVDKMTLVKKVLGVGLYCDKCGKMVKRFKTRELEMILEGSEFVSLVDGKTDCCWYDLGEGAEEAYFCPSCGDQLKAWKYPGKLKDKCKNCKGTETYIHMDEDNKYWLQCKDCNTKIKELDKDEVSNRLRLKNMEYSVLETKLVDGKTICCGYDLGKGGFRANYCPVCRSRITERINNK